MAEVLKDENPRKDLYRMLLADKTPGVADKIKKYSFNQFEKHLLSNEDAQNELGWYLEKKGVVSDPTDFSQRYIQEPAAPPAPKPQAAPVAPPPVEEEPYVPEPQPLVGSPEYDAQLQAHYQGMTPTLGATFGGVPAAFETKAQKKQEQISPAFKAQKLAFEDVPIAEEQRRAQRQFAKATKERQQAALMGGPGFEVEQKKRKKERGYGEWGEDVVGSWVEGGKRIGKNILSTVGYFAQTQAATDPMANLPYEKRQEMMQQASQTMYDNATAAQNTFQNEIAKRNIQTSVLQAINKGEYSRLPESVLYTVGDAAMQIIPSILTFGGSTYAQTLPQVYKDGVDAIAKEKGISPEQAIANGDDAFVVSQINAGVQSALEYAGAGLVSKGIASKGGYKAMRDWLLSQNVNRRLAQGAALLGVGTGEAATEYGQELTGQIGKTAAKSSTTKAFLDKLPNEIFTPEARNQRAEAFVGGLVGGLGLTGAGQAIQSAMDRTLFEAPKIGKATQRADYDVVQTDNKITERNKIAQAMEEAVKANPEAEGQIRQQYQKRINEAAPTDEEVLSAYESLSVLPETEEKNTIRENLEGYMAEKGIQAEPTGMDAGLGELMRREPSVIQTVNAEFPAPVAEEAVTEELTPEEEDEDLAAFGREVEAIEQAAPVASAEEEVVTEEVPETTGMFEGIEGPPMEEAAPEAPAAPAAPAPKGRKKAAPVTPAPAAPEENDAVQIAPQREGGSPRNMVFKDGQWQQNVGGDIVKVGSAVQQQAQEAFAGKEEAKPAETKEGKKAEAKGSVATKVEEYEGVFNPDKTGVAGIDELLTDDGYQFFYKGKKVERVLMSPDEYLERVRKGLKTKTDANILEGKTEAIKKAIESGVKINAPFISTVGGKFSQEGRNRAVVARELGEQKIPVFIESGVTFDDKINRGAELVKQSQDKGNKTKESVLEDIKKSGLHRDGVRFIEENYDAIQEKVSGKPIAETKEGKKAEAKEEKPTAVVSEKDIVSAKIKEIAEKFKSIESELQGEIDVQDFSDRLRKRYEEIKSQYGEAKANEVLKSESNRADKIIKESRDGILKRLKGEYFKKNGFAPSSIRDFQKGIDSGEYKIDDLPSYKDAVSAKIVEETKPSAPSFTSEQSSEAATAFDKAKTSKGFDKKYGKGAYKALSDITKNFEDIMDKVSEKIKQDCIV